GGKADALNCGINASRCPYFCSVDADSLLEKDALIRIMTPVIESSRPVVACGGVVRVLNGVELEDEISIGKINLPVNRLILFQIVIYPGISVRQGGVGCTQFPADSLRHVLAVSQADGHRCRRIQGRKCVRGHGDDREASSVQTEAEETIPHTVHLGSHLLDRSTGELEDARPPAAPMAPRADPKHQPKQSDDLQSPLRNDRYIRDT